jgi:hypothetical protein
MGSIPGGDENFLSKYPQRIKIKINVLGAGKPFT